MERKVVSAKPIKAGSEHRIENMSEIHRFTNTELDGLKILYQGAADTHLLKVFRDLRTRVYAKASGKNFVCMVTAVVPKGGGTYVTSNLAAAISLDKARTSLVVDCNFYAPAMNQLIVTDAETGLTDFLENPKMGAESVIYASGIPRLRVVPVGTNTEGATERMSSQRAVKFLKEVKTRYADRYILVDAPSVSEYAADARIIASLCDFVILVVPYGKVTDSQVRVAINAIGEERLAGLVFNHM